jgi:hypothetical protein
MTTYLHGTTRTTWAAHIGACLTDDEDSATESAAIHGGTVVIYSVDLELAGLVVEDRTHEVRRDDNHYPGDTIKDLARLAAEGVDVVTYDDETESGRTMRTVRLVSQRAVDAAAVIA